jgi:mitochondrial fission protein ELM1
MRAAGITRPFAGRIEHWSYPPLDDTARAGATLRALVVERCGRQASA